VCITSIPNACQTETRMHLSQKKRHTGRWHCRQAYQNTVRTTLLAKSWHEANWYDDTHTHTHTPRMFPVRFRMSTVTETMSVFPRQQIFFENSIMLPDPSKVSLAAAMPRRLQIRTVLRRLAGKLVVPTVHHVPLT